MPAIRRGFYLAMPEAGHGFAIGQPDIPKVTTGGAVSTYPADW
jgi:hypothetical protein